MHGVEIHFVVTVGKVLKWLAGYQGSLGMDSYLYINPLYDMIQGVTILGF